MLVSSSSDTDDGDTPWGLLSAPVNIRSTMLDFLLFLADADFARRTVLVNIPALSDVVRLEEKSVEVSSWRVENCSQREDLLVPLNLRVSSDEANSTTRDCWC